MDLEGDAAGELGYEASKEKLMRSSSLLLRSDSTNSSLLPNESRNEGRQPFEATPGRRKATTPPSPADDQSLSSPTAPGSDREPAERLQPRSRRGSTTTSTDSDGSLSTSSPESRQKPSIHYHTKMFTGKTAREVAERAQDRMLIQAGLQKSPSQLIKKVSRPYQNMETKPMYSGKSVGVCDHCRRKKIRCLHRHIEYNAHFDKGLLTTYEDHHPSALHDGVSKFKPTLTKRESPPRKRGKPSRWRERRAKENARIAQQQDVERETVEDARNLNVVPRRKPGRPMGWKKEMGLSYADFMELYGTSNQ